MPHTISEPWKHDHLPARPFVETVLAWAWVTAIAGVLAVLYLVIAGTGVKLGLSGCGAAPPRGRQRVEQTGALKRNLRLRPPGERKPTSLGRAILPPRLPVKEAATKASVVLEVFRSL